MVSSTIALILIFLRYIDLTTQKLVVYLFCPLRFLYCLKVDLQDQETALAQALPVALRSASALVPLMAWVPVPV